MNKVTVIVMVDGDPATFTIPVKRFSNKDDAWAYADMVMRFAQEAFQKGKYLEVSRG